MSKRQNGIPEAEMKSALLQMGERAKLASRALGAMDSKRKDACLLAMADALEAAESELLAANAKDMKAAEADGLSPAMLDRLRLDSKRVKSMAEGLRHITTLEDPVGRTISTTVRPNGLKIMKVSVPIGVIAIIYEARPNVTVDAAGLCLKAGNAVLLRGGSEAINSNIALASCISRAGLAAGMPEGAVQLIPWIDRAAVSAMLKMDAFIDLVIPRGGEGLIRAVVEQSTIPVIKHYKGVCHVFVDATADQEMALSIIENAKCQRPGVCNAIEKVLIHESIAEEFAPKMAARLKAKGVELRGDDKFLKLVPSAKPASEDDWYEEYLALILAVKVVPSCQAAIDHVNKYSSGHSDCIISADASSSEAFLSLVDSATVYVNASTRFTDGGEFGMGAEIGISTDKLHARGPMGLVELTSYKYKIYGDGQVRG